MTRRGRHHPGICSHCVDASLGMAYVKRGQPIPPDLIRNTRFEIGIGERRVAAQAYPGAWQDPRNQRTKG